MMETEKRKREAEGEFSLFQNSTPADVLKPQRNRLRRSNSSRAKSV